MRECEGFMWLDHVEVQSLMARLNLRATDEAG
jgi:hypothetical protein